MVSAVAIGVLMVVVAAVCDVGNFMEALLFGGNFRILT